MVNESMSVWKAYRMKIPKINLNKRAVLPVHFRHFTQLSQFPVHVAAKMSPLLLKTDDYPNASIM